MSILLCIVSQCDANEEGILHGSLRIERVQAVECRKNALVNDDSRTFRKSRDKRPKDLDTVLVRPVVEDGTEIVDIRLDGLWRKEVAASVVSMRSATGPQSYCAMNVTLSLRFAGSRRFPSATVSGRSCTMQVIAGN
jgi:hypothetical protein